MDSNHMYEQNTGNTQENPQYSSYYEGAGQQPVYPVRQQPDQELEPPVTVGSWLISMLLMCIPCVNIVLMFVWAFSSSESKSKSNFFKAALIWYGIALVLTIIMTILMAGGMLAAMA